jgi:acid phosphatase type 7
MGGRGASRQPSGIVYGAGQGDKEGESMMRHSTAGAGQGDKEGESMMRHSQTMRAASRLLPSHPIVCLLTALAAAAVVLGAFGPIEVVHAADVASPVEGENFANKPTGTEVVTDTTRGYSGNRALNFRAPVTASHTVRCSQVCDVVLRARGSQSGGSPTISVNGSAPQAITSSALANYTFNVNLPAGTNTVLRVTAGNVATGRNAFLDIATFPADGGTTTPPPTTSARLVGAGDIGNIGDADIATGNLIDARPSARVFTAGDNAYPNGSASDFTNHYHPAWGPFKNRTSPTPGNHDYNTSGASAYKNYFGSVAGLRSVNPTYYAYTLGAWRVYALDSNISMKSGSPQYNFVQQDLAANGALCELAYWHHPIASSGQHGNEAVAQPIFALFDAQGGDLVLNGHDHNYERFTKINSSGQVSASGVRQIVVGTGGTDLRGPGFVQPGSEVRNFNTHGIVDITLSSTGYSGKFVPAPGFGSFTDSFSGTCGRT